MDFKVILHGYTNPDDSAKVIPKELGSQRYTALNKQLPEITAKQIGADVLSFNCDLRLDHWPDFENKWRP